MKAIFKLLHWTHTYIRHLLSLHFVNLCYVLHFQILILKTRVHTFVNNYLFIKEHELQYMDRVIQREKERERDIDRCGPINYKSLLI